MGMRITPSPTMPLIKPVFESITRIRPSSIMIPIKMILLRIYFALAGVIFLDWGLGLFDFFFIETEMINYAKIKKNVA
jgi:hypothetical protein